jgi:hypothetical protein
MNELAEPVGRSPAMYYFPSRLDAFNGSNELGHTQYLSGIWIVGQITHPSPGILNNRIWLIDPISSSSEIPSNIVYTNGDTVVPDLIYVFYPAPPCFLEGTKILCQVDGVDTYLPIESMKPGTLVKTSLNGYKKVELIGNGKMQNPGHNERIEQRLYKCSSANYPELTEDIYLTGCHSILVSSITDLQREKLVKQLNRIFVTDKKYRLTAFVDERAEPWASEGQYTIWHFALENDNVKMNYGVYASGLLVETCCIDTLQNKSGFTMV